MRPTISTGSGYAILLIFFVMGCRSGASLESDPTRVVDGDCVQSPGSPDRLDAITIVLTEQVDPARAPIPTNEAERLVFRHLYETLVTVDCRGHVQPGLARSWKESENGRLWEFTLRENARFSDGSHLTGEDVREAWETARPRLPQEPGPGLWVHPDSVRTHEDRVLVYLSEAVGKEPFLFAHPGLAVVPSTGAGWPVGSGPYLLSHSAAGALTLIPNPYHPEAGRGASPLEIQVQANANPRDLLSGPGDVLFIEDRSALEFARGFADRSLHPLAWNRTYFLVSPGLAFVSLHPEAQESLVRLRLELSRDVVTSDARPAIGPECSRRSESKESASDKPYPRLLSDPLEGRAPRILYRSEDRDAGRLAERLVALALAENQLSTSSDPRVSTIFPFPLDLDPDADLVATGVPMRPFQDAMAAGREWALVVSYYSTFPDPCLDALAFRQNLDWLSSDPLEGSSPIVPLVSTRRHLALRRGLVGVETDWNGTVLLNRAGWGEEINP